MGCFLPVCTALDTDRSVHAFFMPICCDAKRQGRSMPVGERVLRKRKFPAQELAICPRACLRVRQHRPVGPHNDCDLSLVWLWVGMEVVPPLEVGQATDVAAAPTLSPRDRLIEAATRLFCRYGVNSVGVDAIVGAAGTAKTTLYKVFGSKDGLVEAVLEREGRLWRTWFLAQIDDPGGSAIERLQRIGPALKLWFSRDDFYGCPFINAVGESDKTDDRMRSLAIAHKQVVLRRLAELCGDAGSDE